MNRILQRNLRASPGGTADSLSFVCREVTAIRSKASVNLIVHVPKTQSGREALAHRAADVHASAVNQRLKSLNCPTSQKLALLAAIIETARTRSRE